MKKNLSYLIIAIFILGIPFIFAYQNFVYELNEGEISLSELYSSKYDICFRYASEGILDCIDFFSNASFIKHIKLDCDEYSIYNLDKFIKNNSNNFIVISPSIPNFYENKTIVNLINHFGIQEVLIDSNIIPPDKHLIIIGNANRNLLASNLISSWNISNSPLLYLIEEDSGIVKIILAGNTNLGTYNLANHFLNLSQHFSDVKSNFCTIVYGCKRPFSIADKNYDSKIDYFELLSFINSNPNLSDLFEVIRDWKNQ